MGTKADTETIGEAGVLEEALTLRHGLGLSYRQIADRLGVPLGTVMSRLHRAHRKYGMTADYSRPGGTQPRMKADREVVRAARRLLDGRTRLEVVNEHTVIVRNR